MRAVLITRPGGPEVLQLDDVATPEPGANQIRVRVHATAVNRADLMQRRGNYPAPAGWPADIPGLEYAGSVESLGAGVTRWQPGDRVMGIVGGGSYAEYVVVHEDEAIALPASLSFEQGAALPEAFLTAYDALRNRLLAGAVKIESVLIHAIASGVGTAALQLAHVMGLRVFGTARSDWKFEQVRTLAPCTLIDVTSADFVQAIRAAGGVDGVLDLVGGDYLPKNIEVCNLLGRIVVIGLVAGATAELNMRQLLNKRLTIVGTVLRARSLAEKIELARAFEAEVNPWLAEGRVRAVVDRVVGIGEVAEAHRLAEANRTVGKVVLAW